MCVCVSVNFETVTPQTLTSLIDAPHRIVYVHSLMMWLICTNVTIWLAVHGLLKACAPSMLVLFHLMSWWLPAVATLAGYFMGVFGVVADRLDPTRYACWIVADQRAWELVLVRGWASAPPSSASPIGCPSAADYVESNMLADHVSRHLTLNHHVVVVLRINLHIYPPQLYIPTAVAVLVSVVTVIRGVGYLGLTCDTHADGRAASASAAASTSAPAAEHSDAEAPEPSAAPPGIWSESSAYRAIVSHLCVQLMLHIVTAAPTCIVYFSSFTATVSPSAHWAADCLWRLDTVCLALCWLANPYVREQLSQLEWFRECCACCSVAEHHSYCHVVTHVPATRVRFVVGGVTCQCFNVVVAATYFVVVLVLVVMVTVVVVVVVVVVMVVVLLMCMMLLWFVHCDFCPISHRPSHPRIRVLSDFPPTPRLTLAQIPLNQRTSVYAKARSSKFRGSVMFFADSDNPFAHGPRASIIPVPGQFKVCVCVCVCEREREKERERECVCVC
jgi:hypothetical protein